MGGGANSFYDRNPNLLDIEKARINGVKLSPLDEERLRNQQLRRARRMYLNTLVLSDREPLWKVGPHGIRYEEAGRTPGDTGNGARSAQALYRFNRFFTDLGADTFRKMGWKNDQGAMTIFLNPEHWKDGLMGRARWLLKAGAMGVFVSLSLGVWIYMNSWTGYLTRYNVQPAVRYYAPPSYPGDDTITGHLHDLTPSRGQHGMDWRHEAKPLPKGSRFDWLTGKVILPEEIATSSYYNKHGFPTEWLTRRGHDGEGDNFIHYRPSSFPYDPKASHGHH